MAVQLYIRNQRVDLDGVVSMPLTKQFDDMANPTVVKNSTSKTISIPATPQNNRIFGNIWRIDHINGGLFDASKREPFTLVNNGAMVMTGYVKLSAIVKTDNTPRSYEVHLFGGLGDFFYSLSGEGKDMKDVVLPNNNLSHKINAAAVVSPPEGMKYFLSYQGRYDNFDSKQVYNPVTESFEELPEDQDEHQRNEFRSYYQRPAFRVASLMEAIFAGSGFDVAVSNLFKATPYWLDTYLALNTPEKNGKDISYNGALYDGVISKSINSNVPGGLGYVNARFINSDPAIFDQEPVFYPNYGYTGFIFLDTLGEDRTLSYDYKFQIEALVLSSSGAPSNVKVQNNPADNQPVQFIMEIYDVTTSSAQLLKKESFDATRGQLTAVVSAGRSGICTFRGTDTVFQFQGAISIAATVKKIQVRFQLLMPRDINSASGETSVYWNNVTNTGASYRGNVSVRPDPNNYIKLTDSVNVRSNSDVSYSTFITRGTSQLDFVKNFFKAFGMLWEKDPLKDSISIFTRNEFFAGHKIVDWTNRIDHSKSMRITPLNHNFRYGVFTWADSSTFRARQYYEQFAWQYGSFKADTGYEFDNTEKNFIADNAIKNIVMSMEYDTMFSGRNNESRRDDKVLPAIFNSGDSGRSKNTETMQILFWNGLATAQAQLRITDDAKEMRPESKYCWTASGGLQRNTYPSMARIKTGTNGGVYSLDFSKPQVLYYPATDADYPLESTIYRRFWADYLRERLTSDTRVMTCYVYITEAEFSTWRFNTFVKIENTLWHVNKIENFDPLKQQSTKVELVRVTDINAYTNGQKL